jgi:hypothetical protein
MCRVLVTGSQLWPDPAVIWYSLDDLLRHVKGCLIVVHGDCKRGADAQAKAWAEERISQGFDVALDSHPADWNGPKKRGAGYARNAEMVKLGADYCLAFIHNDSNGSSHTAGLAEDAGIPTKIYRSYSVGANDRNVTLEGVRIVFRNFEGRPDKFNPNGNRSFHVVLDEDQAGLLEKMGFNVKRKPPREEGDEPFNHLKVKVSFTGRPPRLVLVTSRGRTTLDEETCEILDYADVNSVDLIINPYTWKNPLGESGVSAYLHALYMIINEDDLEKKYRDVPEIGQRPQQLALEEGLIDVEIISETEDFE